MVVEAKLSLRQEPNEPWLIGETGRIPAGDRP